MFGFSLIPAALILFIGQLDYSIIVAAMSLLVLFMSSAQLYLLSYLPIHFNRWGKGATVSGIISRLEAKGFLESVSAEDDRRKKLIMATEKAKKCDSTVAEQIKETEELLLKNFSEEEKEMLFMYISRMLDNIGAQTPEKREDEKC